jgi:hypothetical protein
MVNTLGVNWKLLILTVAFASAGAFGVAVLVGVIFGRAPDEMVMASTAAAIETIIESFRIVVLLERVCSPAEVA